MCMDATRYRRTTCPASSPDNQSGDLSSEGGWIVKGWLSSSFPEAEGDPDAWGGLFQRPLEPPAASERMSSLPCSAILPPFPSWWLSGKESACQAGDVGSTPGMGRSPGEGNGSPAQYSHLGNPKDRGAWWAIVHRFEKSWTRLTD